MLSIVFSSRILDFQENFSSWLNEVLQTNSLSPFNSSLNFSSNVREKLYFAWFWPALFYSCALKCWTFSCQNHPVSLKQLTILAGSRVLAKFPIYDDDSADVTLGMGMMVGELLFLVTKSLKSWRLDLLSNNEICLQNFSFSSRNWRRYLWISLSHLEAGENV